MAFTKLREGEPLDDVVLSHGYESHSGFRDAFARNIRYRRRTADHAGIDQDRPKTAALDLIFDKLSLRAFRV